MPVSDWCTDHHMQLYTIRRRSAWAPLDELKGRRRALAADRPEIAAELRWIRSYVVNEADGTLGSPCVDEATSQSPSAAALRARPEEVAQ
jgi:hypothetical protein